MINKCLYLTVHIFYWGLNRYFQSNYTNVASNFKDDRKTLKVKLDRMRLLSILLFTMISTSALYGQQTLYITKNMDCEVFPEKGKFNGEERLKKIKEIGGKLVTVYLVKGKDNKIKTKYTGRVDLRSIDDNKLSLDTRTKVLVVAVDQGSGKMMWFFPLTDDKNYRIYLADCVGQ